VEEVSEQQTYLGFPRGEIEWYPRIDYELCTNCGICVKSCEHNVYAKENDKAMVVQPYNCLVGCESCKYKCPVSAIKFPSREELKQMLRELRKKYGYR